MTANHSPNTDLLFEHFATLATAPDGIARLRELILQLAVQGKLGTQDAGDEPALKLVEGIRKEKDRLVKEGKIKRGKPLEKIKVVPYNVPDGWQWCQLGEISEIIMGNSPPGDTYNIYGDGVPLINGPTEFSKNPLGKTIVSQYTTQPTKFCKENDLLICVRGATTGRTNIAGFDACVGRGVAVIRSPSIQSYLNLFILTKAQQILNMGTGSTFPSISQDDLLTITVPLPPLAEQHRIVAKVDRLMALCDELEARQQQERAGCLRLGTASLAGLQNAETPEEFERHWAQVCDAFELILDCPENVKVLRQTILQLAVRGRLVRQEPGDEPAGKLVEKIKKERAELDKKWKIFDPISENELLYSNPKGWIWTRLGDIAILKSGSTFDQSFTISENGVPFVKVGDMNYPGNEKLITTSSHLVNITEDKRRELIPKNSIIFPKRGGAIATNKKRIVATEIFVDSNTMAMICPPSINLHYLYLWFLQFDLWSLNSGTSVPQINHKDIDPLLFPLPPLTEQHRIVEKVDSLMALCDALESHLKERAGVQGRLAGAVVKQVAG